METIFNYNNGKDFIEHQTKVGEISYRAISESADIHTSYFSRVMAGKANFNQQQAFKISHYLGLTGEEQEYFLQLCNLDRAQNNQERQFYKKWIRAAQEKKLKITSRLEGPVVNVQSSDSKYQVYYREAITTLIHIHLTIPAFRRDPEKIRQKLDLGVGKFKKELEKLVDIGLVKLRLDGSISDVASSIHLDELSDVSVQNHISWRLRTISNLERREVQEGDFHLSVAFSADAETKMELKNLLRNFAVQAQKRVGKCDSPEQVYQLTLDLY